MVNKRIIDHITYKIEQSYYYADSALIALFALFALFDIELKRLIPGKDRLMSGLQFIDSSPHILFEANHLIINDDDIYLT